MAVVVTAVVALAAAVAVVAVVTGGGKFPPSRSHAQSTEPRVGRPMSAGSRSVGQ